MLCYELGNATGANGSISNAKKQDRQLMIREQLEGAFYRS